MCDATQVLGHALGKSFAGAYCSLRLDNTLLLGVPG